MGDPAKIRIIVNGVEYTSLDALPPALRLLAEKQFAAAREAARQWTPQSPPGKIDVKFKIDIRRSGAPPAGASRPPSAAAVWMRLKR